MTRKCCVPGCTSNYKSASQKGAPSITTFSFPINDEKKRNKWLIAIPRKNWEPTKYSAVCIKHFKEDDVILSTLYKNSKGETQKLLLKYPKLKNEAVPLLLHNLPSYLSPKSSFTRRNPELRRQRIKAREAEQIESFLKADFIGTFDKFNENFEKQLETHFVKWHHRQNQGSVWFYLLNSSFTSETPPQVLFSILVGSDLVVKVFNKNEVVSPQHLKGFLPYDLKLTRWSQLKNLFVNCNNLVDQVDLV